MKSTAKKSIITGFIFLITFVIFTLFVQTIDLQITPSTNTYIGFSTINIWFHNFTGVNMSLYDLTDWLSIIPLTVCLFHGMQGLCQLITRKNIFKVDGHILISGIYYVVVILCFVIFETFPVNYRPVLINGVCEASYPSSTTLLVLTVMPAFIFKLRIESTGKIIPAIATAYTVVMVTARLFCGVHWLTDIIGGILLSSGLFYIYKGAILIYDYKQTQSGANYGIQ